MAGCEAIAAAGLYNGSVQVYPASSLRTAAASGKGTSTTLYAHGGAVTSAHALDVASTATKGGKAQPEALLVTGGRDGVARLWQVRCGAASTSVTEVATLVGAPDAVTSVAIDPTGRLVAAGDGRGGVHFWSASVAQQDGDSSAAAAAAPAPKAGKRARADSSSSAAPPAPSRSPVFSLPTAHAGSGPVTGVAWGGAGATLVTCGWGDASVRVWTVTESEAASVEDGRPAFSASLARVVPMPGNQAPHALAASLSGSLFATAHGDGCVRVWGTSEEGSEADGGRKDASGPRAVLSMPASTGGGSSASTWVASVSWCPASGHYLAGCGHNGSVAVWDVRAPPAPLFSLPPHVDGDAAGAPRTKALAVAWAGAAKAAAVAAPSTSSASPQVASGPLDGLAIVSGGADKKMRVSHFGA